MSPEQQRIAIAEWCGFKPGIEREIPYRKVWWKGGSVFCDCDLPDYLNDLNAVHEAEKLLVKKDIWWKYCTILNGKICDDSDEPLNQDPETLWMMIHATAAQRAEALLRTIGKWQDQQKAPTEAGAETL